MSAATAHPEDQAHSHEPSPAVQLRSNRLGLWLFFFSEIFLFAALLVARFVLLLYLVEVTYSTKPGPPS